MRLVAGTICPTRAYKVSVPHRSYVVVVSTGKGNSCRLELLGVNLQIMPRRGDQQHRMSSPVRPRRTQAP